MPSTNVTQLCFSFFQKVLVLCAGYGNVLNMTFNSNPSTAKKIEIANFVHGVAMQISEASFSAITSFIGQPMAIQSGATSAKGKKLVAQVEAIAKRFETGFHGKPYGINAMVYMSNSRNLILKLSFFDNGENAGYAEFYLASGCYWTHLLESVIFQKFDVVDVSTVQNAIADVSRLEEELRKAKDKIPYFLKK